MSQFEGQVLSLLDTVNGSNVQDVQRQLTSLFKESEKDDKQREHNSNKALVLSNGMVEDTRALLLLSAALEVSWPEYPGGDGYFSAPSQLATAATLLGINNCEPSFVEFTKELLPCQAVQFFDLGLAANPEASAEQVLFAQERSNYDPVRAVASVSQELNDKQIREVLENLESGVWLSSVLLKSDGWTWPEWQYAFEQASNNTEPSELFWSVLLNEIRKAGEADTSETSWVTEFLDEFEASDGLDPDVSGGLFDLMTSSENLQNLARLSGWDALVEAIDDL